MQGAKNLCFFTLNTNILQSMQSKVLKDPIARYAKKIMFNVFALCNRNANFDCF